MSSRKTGRYRLALRIYLVSVLQMVVIVLGFIGIMRANRAAQEDLQGGDRWFEAQAGYVAEHLEPLLGNPSAVNRELQALQRRLGATATVLDSAGSVIASSAPAHRASCTESSLQGPRRRPPCSTLPLQLPDGGQGTLMLFHGPPPRLPPPPPWATVILPFVLLVVGVTSVLLARSLTGPLRKMSDAARHFGAGKLSARTGVNRHDELGEVARAFDETAERISILLRAEKELLANVSHELATPLARIGVALDLAAQGDAHVARESLAEIAVDLHELEQLIADVITAARLDRSDGAHSGTDLPFRPQQVNLPAILQTAAGRFRAAHPGRRIELDVEQDLPPIEGDPLLLRRAVRNLLENADKYTPDAEAPVVLRARQDDGVLIEIVDQGIGIADNDLPYVFTPFFRTDRSRTRKSGGMGLGLVLVQRIVQAHGGSVELDSTPGKGTRARLRLPTGESH